MFSDRIFFLETMHFDYVFSQAQSIKNIESHVNFSKLVKNDFRFA